MESTNLAKRYSDISNVEFQFQQAITTLSLAFGLWFLFIVFTLTQKKICGYSQLFLTLWLLCQISSPILLAQIINQMKEYRQMAQEQDDSIIEYINKLMEKLKVISYLQMVDLTNN